MSASRSAITVWRMQCAIGCPSPRSAAYDRVATSSAPRTPPACAIATPLGCGPATRRVYGRSAAEDRRLLLGEFGVGQHAGRLQFGERLELREFVVHAT